MIIKNFKTFLFLTIILVLLVTACKPEEDDASPLSANLSEIQGVVEIKQAGEQDFTPAQTGSTLGVDGQIETGDDGKARLDLSTGTIIRVSPSSLFTLASNEEVDDGLATKVKLELGRIFITLNGGSMEVDTPSGVASVRGSHMMVEVDPVTNNVLVTCLTGHCAASNQAGTVDFTEGEKTVLFAFDPETGQFLPPGVEPMDPEDYKKWLDENPDIAEIINQAIGTMTAMAATQPPATEPPATEPAVTEPAFTEASTSGGSSGSGAGVCQILEPGNGTDFQSSSDGLTFAWEEQTGATKYILEFVYPNGFVVQFETTDTSMTRDPESLAPGGEYSWSVSAYDENGGTLCTSTSVTFKKDDTLSWEEKQDAKKEKNKDDDLPPDDPSPTDPPPTDPPPTDPPPTDPPPTCDPCDYYGDCFGGESQYCYGSSSYYPY